MAVSQKEKKKTELLHDLAIPLLVLYSKELKQELEQIFVYQCLQ